MSDEIPEIPVDLLEDILRYGKMDIRRGRQNEKDKWIARARALFVPSERQNCHICGRHIGITHAHHVIPLSAQFDRGFKEQDDTHVWLCPNHHAIIHLFLSGTSVAGDTHFGGLLEDFTKDQAGALHQLLLRSRSGAVT